MTTGHRRRRRGRKTTTGMQRGDAPRRRCDRRSPASLLAAGVQPRRAGRRQSGGSEGQGVGDLRRLAGGHHGKVARPGVHQGDGYPFEGFGGGSNEDAAAIKGKVRQADVFVSAAASADKELEGASNGNWVSWYSTFASSDLVLGYDPKTKFGKELAAGKPWYKVITEPGILVGRTEPKADPKGKLTVEAVDAAAKKLHDPSLTKALKHFPIFEETAMLARLQAGQLDAGFFYVVEAKEAHVPTVPLTPIYKYADYTMTILEQRRKPGRRGSARVVPAEPEAQGASESDYGLVPIKPTLSGSASAVPKGLRSIVGAG